MSLQQHQVILAKKEGNDLDLTSHGFRRRDEHVKYNTARGNKQLNPEYVKFYRVNDPLSSTKKWG